MPSWYISYLPAWLNRWWQPSERLNPYRSINITTESTTGQSVLNVITADIYRDINHGKHHTDYFYAAEEALIVRRGDPFRIRFNFNRPFNPEIDAISLIFTVANEKKPSPGHGTLIGLVPRFNINYMSDPLEWEAVIEEMEGHFLVVSIKPSVTCPVTEWKIDIDTKIMGNGSKTFMLDVPVYILFNPWCPNDQVYIPGHGERKEYILNDTTLIWRGSYNRLRPSVWKLGQFEKHVLECSLNLLGTVGRIPASHRGDPVRVSRALSAAVNSVDDDGVVLGNWTEDFSGGIAPTKWIGSTEILQQYYKTKKPVKYGQCWNFAGVLTTIARALGIPSRIVTCYSSAHDTQASLTVDIFIDENNKKMESETTDSIWNYHVWNEVWMARPDLGVGSNGIGYDGWQVVDATPQEASDNMFRVGPASVQAVKNGEILRPFDSGFVYSEVNADKVYWRYNGPFQPLKLLRKDSLAIGHLISTKAVMKWEREDITDLYKYKERTQEERNVMLKALKQSRQAFSRYYLNDSFNDIEFDMQLRDDIKIGEHFEVILAIINKSENKLHTANGQLSCDSVLYTGLNGEEIKIMKFQVNIKPSVTEYVRMEVRFEDYFKKLTSQASFNISCAATVQKTDYEYFAQDDFRVRKPDIKFTFQGDLIAKQQVDVIVRLKNPLPIPLKKGLFEIEGPGIEKVLRFKIAEIPAGGTAASTFKYIPPYAGRATLVAKFTCKELDDVDGYAYYEVQPHPNNIIMTNLFNDYHIRRRTNVIP